MATEKTTNVQAQVDDDEALVEEFANFKPAFDKPTMYRAEATAGGQAIAVQRRVALAVLTMSADELSEVSKTDPTTFGEMTAAVQGVEQHLKALHHMARAASLRLQIADLRGAVQ